MSLQPNPARTLVMQVLNLTPDSFSDGGRLTDPQALLATAENALEAGADVLDVGGESTRPGAQEVPIDTELERVLAPIRLLKQTFPKVRLSIDTRKAHVAQKAIESGADIINDISGLQFDPNMANVAAETGATLILMHSLGTPETMQDNPQYQNILTDLMAFFKTQISKAESAGVRRDQIWLDPGFGFGKTLEHNLTLLRHLDTFKALGFPMMVGTSRKSFLTLGQGSPPPTEREALTTASLAMAIAHGADMVRIHDARTQIPAIRLIDAIARQA